jgi:tetratricopeptide (TPR) repeat protein
MTAASPDLNQGALLLLMAFMVAWHGFAKATGAGRMALVLVQISLCGALLISQSRSALICAAAFILFSTARYCLKKNRMALVIFVVISALAAVAIGGPVQEWMTREDSSTSSRAITYRAALQEVPHYLIIGTGLGASDEALARTEHGRGANGRTIHSVPLKLLLETGLLGLAAYAWFWVLLALRTRRIMLRSSRDDEQRLGKALLWMGVAIITMQFVQPFTTMPHFPILLGIWAGAVMTTREVVLTDHKYARWSPAFVAAAVVPLTALVAFNIWLYQAGSRRVTDFADLLAQGPPLESVGRWDDAREVYEKALAIASPMTDTEGPILLGGIPVSQMPFYDVLATVIDIPQVEGQMNVLSDRPDPEAVCHFGIGRTALAQGDTDTATKHFGAGLKDRHFVDLRFILADFLWNSGHYSEALLNYRLAALHANEWRNLRFRFRMAEFDERIAVLDNASSLHGWLERAYLLRQRGRWPEALAIYEEVYKGAPETPEAAFALGVHAFLGGEYAAAREYWEPIAVNHADDFPEAAKALENLSAQDSNLDNGNRQGPPIARF